MAQNETLIATIMPDDASDKTLTWSSSDDAVATVGSNGEVSAVSVGTSTVTVRTVNDLTDTCNVTVTKKKTFDYVDEINNTYLVNAPTLQDNGNLDIIASNYFYANKAYINEESSLPLDEPWIVEVEYTLTNASNKRMILIDRSDGDYGEFCIIANSPASSTDIPPSTAVSISQIKSQVSGFNQSSECCLVMNTTDADYPSGRHTIKYIYNGDGAMYIVFDNIHHNKALIMNRERLSRELHYFFIGSTSETTSYTYSANGALHKLHILNPNNELALGKSHIDTLIGRTERVDFEVLGGTGTVTWESSDPQVATVDSNGNTTGVGLGDCTITGTLGEQTVTITLTVVETSIADYVDEVNNTFILQGASVNQTNGVIQGVATPNNEHSNITFLNEPCLLSMAPEAEWEIEILLFYAPTASGAKVTAPKNTIWPINPNSISLTRNSTGCRYQVFNYVLGYSLSPTEVSTEPVIFTKILGTSDILVRSTSYADYTLTVAYDPDNSQYNYLNIYSLCTGYYKEDGRIVKPNNVTSIKSLYIRKP